MNILIVALALWVAGLFLLPITIWRDEWDSNASNWPGVIIMKRGLPVPGAVWAQEYWEARHSWRWLPVHVALTLLGRVNPKWAGWTRSRELMGHEVEVWAEAMLTGSAPDDIRRREARALAGYPCFAGWLPETIEIEMRRNWVDARAFVDRHADKIRGVD